MKEKRRVWGERVPGLDVEKLVFLDEIGANTKMTRRYGRAPRGKRVVGLTAPMVIDGVMNGDLFVAYVE